MCLSKNQFFRNLRRILEIIHFQSHNPMNMLSSRLLGAVVLVLSFFALQAQDSTSTIVYLEDQQVDPAEVFDVDIKVTNFNDIISAAFGLSWDTDQLRYVGVENLALDVPMENINTMNVNDGGLSYLFFDSSLLGESLEDDAVLFTLQLEVVGMEGDQSEITFTGSNPNNPAEVININEEMVGVFNNANIVIGNPDNTVELAEYGWTATITPNPFKNNANIQLQIAEAGNVYWKVSDVSGRAIAEGQQDYGVGEHVLVLKNQVFPQPGTYVLQLQMGETVITRRMLYID